MASLRENIFKILIFLFTLTSVQSSSFAGGENVVQYLSDEDKNVLLNKLLDERAESRSNANIKMMIESPNHTEELLEKFAKGILSRDYLVDDEIPVLTYSVLAGNHKLFNYLITNYKNIPKSIVQRTFEIACVLDEYTIIRQLLSVGADPNELPKNNHDWCIFSAIKNGNEELVQELSNLGIDKDISNKNDQSVEEYVDELLHSTSQIKKLLNQ